MKISDIVEFNPTRTLKKGILASFVEMAAVPEYVRDIAYLDEKEFNSGSKFKNGDTLFARITPCLENGKTAKVNCLRDDEIAHGSTEFIVMAPRSENDEDFVYYLSRDPEFREFAKSRMQGTSGRQRVSWQSLADYELPDIEPAVRKRIGEILKGFDDKIALNREINKTLEAMAQAIFKSWFVDFEPFKEGEFVESELGMIPKGWEVKPLTECTKVIGGGTPKTSIPEYWNGDIPWFSVVDAPSGSDVFVVETEKSITQEGLNNSSTKLLDAGMTIVTARGTVGKIALAGTTMTMNQSCYALAPIDDTPYFTYYLVSSSIAELKQKTHGSVFDTITRETLSSIQVIKPNIDVKKFESKVEPIMLRIKKNLLEIKTLAALRDTLLPKLLSGEIEV